MIFYDQTFKYRAKVRTFLTTLWACGVTNLYVIKPGHCINVAEVYARREYWRNEAHNCRKETRYSKQWQSGETDIFNINVIIGLYITVISKVIVKNATSEDLNIDVPQFGGVDDGVWYGKTF